ncbi:MAG: hypothetical protein N3F05_01155 [Candidatus Diapherotrites archaeon]|nr:hypothetical protein [Candidatus Diapherotrites archaeon]
MANYCKSDVDCKAIVLGGEYIAFGCYHFVNKDFDQNSILSKVQRYKHEMKCSTIINRCAPVPEAKCVSGKCVHSD